MFEEFLRKVERVIKQYEEGSIYAEEAFNAITNLSYDVTLSEVYTEHIRKKAEVQ